MFLSLLLVIPAGFLFKHYDGPGQHWFNDYCAGILYEIFWVLVIFLFIPRREYAFHIVATIFLITCFLEILQLFSFWPLESVRGTYAGRALIGTTFVWADFPHYIIGCGLAYFWIVFLSRHFEELPVEKVKILSDHEFGRWAENRACKVLKNKGLKVLARNFRTPRGEIDIIVTDRESIIFVEVKAQRNLFGISEDKFDSRKRSRITKTAKAYIAAKELYDLPFRFDLVTVEIDKDNNIIANHYEDI